MKTRYVLWGLVWSVLFLFSINCTYRLWVVYPLLSIRFAEPLKEGQAETIIESFRSSENLEDSSVSLTFWKETATNLTSDWGTSDATLLTYYGEGRVVYPAAVLEGRLPAAREENRCAVSDSVAWQLWGSRDVLGQTVKIDDHVLIIYGVFRSSEHIVLCGGNLNEQYENIECAGTFLVEPVETMKAIVRTSGITQDTLYYFPIPWIVATTLYVLLPAVIVILRLVYTFKYEHKRFSNSRNSNRYTFLRNITPIIRLFLIPMLALCIALLLPALLNLLPVWTTPSQWSDFSFWSSITSQLYESIQQFFSLQPFSKDVLAKWYLLKGCTAATSTLILSLTLFTGIDFRMQSYRHNSGSRQTKCPEK